jgi:hypothetical protein
LWLEGPGFGRGCISQSHFRGDAKPPACMEVPSSCRCCRVRCHVCRPRRWSSRGPGYRCKPTVEPRQQPTLTHLTAVAAPVEQCAPAKQDPKFHDLQAGGATPWAVPTGRAAGVEGDVEFRICYNYILSIVYLFISSELSRSSAPALHCSPRSPTRADPPGVSAEVLASRGVTALGRLGTSTRPVPSNPNSPDPAVVRSCWQSCTHTLHIVSETNIL